MRYEIWEQWLHSNIKEFRVWHMAISYGTRKEAIETLDRISRSRCNVSAMIKEVKS